MSEDGAAVAVGQVKTNKDKEDVAVMLMLSQKMKPKKSMKMAGLD